VEGDERLPGDVRVSASAPVPANCWRTVSTDSTLTMPATMIVDSTMRVAT
jgi:hypothetical protein